jgi:OPA family sugar phosphate sensor protein UhpC-like MFS transporter
VSLTSWFSNRERGRYYGIWSTAHSLGEGLTFFCVAAVVSWLGWRAGFLVPGLLCIGVAWAIYRWAEDRPQTLGLPPVAEWANDHGTAQPVTQGHGGLDVLRTQLSILKLPAIWVLAAASATMYVTRYAINSWGVLYLQEARGFSLVEAGTMITAGTLAGLAGCVAYGFVSDKWFAARRPPANLAFALLETLPLFVIFYGPDDRVIMTAAFALFGFGLSGILASLGGLFAVDIAPKRAAGAVMGFIGVFSYVGAGLQEKISGRLIEDGIRMVDGVRVYDFSAAIEFWIGASMVSMILAALLWRVRVRD